VRRLREARADRARTRMFADLFFDIDVAEHVSAEFDGQCMETLLHPQQYLAGPLLRL
jgi:hypothetical protein